MDFFKNRMEAFGTMRQLAICAILVAGAANASIQAVTETSGDPAAIAAIETSLTAIDRDTPRYRRTTHTLLEYSAEGGTLVGFYDDASLRKLSASLIGESGRLTQHMYYSADQLVFVDSIYEQYETKARVEHRVYLSAGRPIRRIRTQSQARPTEEVSVWDPLPELLTRVTEFVTCAAASTETCTAPKR
jgi:hypothetical protein